MIKHVFYDFGFLFISLKNVVFWCKTTVTQILT